jgi:ribosomal protein L7/L12
LKIADIAMPVAAAPAGGAPAAAAAAAAAEAAAEDAPPAAAEKAILTVKLESFDAASKAKVIREVKALLACNLVEAKNLVEKAPTVIKENVVKEVFPRFGTLTCRTRTNSRRRWKSSEQRLHWNRIDRRYLHNPHSICPALIISPSQDRQLPHVPIICAMHYLSTPNYSIYKCF